MRAVPAPFTLPMAPRRDDWIVDGDRMTHRIDADRSILLLDGQWRLLRVERKGRGSVPIYDSPSLDAVLSYDAYLDAYEDFADRFSERRIRRTFGTQVPGIQVRVVKDRGHGAFVQVVEEGEVVPSNTYSFGLSSAAACYIAGEPTINGASMLSPQYIGRGIGRAMYDAAASATGIQPTPHGCNRVGGSLSSKSAPFWRKRIAQQHVPGFDQSASIRSDELDRCLVPSFWLSMHEWSEDVAHSLAALSGGEAMGIVVDREGEPSIARAWCRLPDGRDLVSTGFLTPDRIESATAESCEIHDLVSAGALPAADPSDRRADIAAQCLLRHAADLAADRGVQPPEKEPLPWFHPLLPSSEQVPAVGMR